MSYEKRFRVRPDERVKLRNHDPGYVEPGVSEHEGLKETKRLCKKLRKLQSRIHSEQQQSVLICLQALDAGGKDGVINHVLGMLSPMSCRVTSFKKPGAVESSRNYLWRVSLGLPAAGEIGVFNRSHYEDVLVVRVHGLIPEAKLDRRYHQINAFEKFLAENDTRVLKFFLHISKEEQLRRFKRRLDDPERNWKISGSDYPERTHWDAYTEAYEEALSRCSTEEAPWYVIPSDCKWFRNLAVARIVADHLEGLHVHDPKPTVNLDDIRKEYDHATHESTGDRPVS
ncbi:MAG TPA: PPK2 family polyphosphate kinase [Gemmataceae bacterium]|nr:PPK2 family polyphosphate kinase [Gemmataceae bacterium]